MRIKGASRKERINDAERCLDDTIRPYIAATRAKKKVMMTCYCKSSPYLMSNERKKDNHDQNKHFSSPAD